MSTRWLESQLPYRLLFWPEALRGAHHVAICLWLASLDGSLCVRSAVASLLEGFLLPVCIPFVCSLCYAPSSASAELTARVDNCPRLLRRPRDALLSLVAPSRSTLFGGVSLLDATAGKMMSASHAVALLSLILTRSPMRLLDVIGPARHTLLVALLASVATKLRPAGGAAALDALIEKQRAADRDACLASLRTALASATTEAGVASAAAAAVAALFPAAAAWGVGVLAEPGGGASPHSGLAVARLAAGGASAAAARRLRRSYPPRGPLGARTSARAACDLSNPCYGTLLDSDDAPPPPVDSNAPPPPSQPQSPRAARRGSLGGPTSTRRLRAAARFDDWARAASGGGASDSEEGDEAEEDLCSRFVTAPLVVRAEGHPTCRLLFGRSNRLVYTSNACR